MTRVEDYCAELRELAEPGWPAYLGAHSGLPGPRGNLELIAAVAGVGDHAMFDRLVATDDEYLTACGVVGLGTVLASGDQSIEPQLRRQASDPRWRVREAVAMALQRVGDADLKHLLEIVTDWVDDPDPLVQRAAVAAICEPRLIRQPEAAAVALRVCRRATDLLRKRSDQVRAQPGTRTLRQALGYCWSVAVAADPGPGLLAFAALRTIADPDVSWIVRENLKKKRLRRLLDQAS
jgi:HEAT repeat protein